MKLVFIFFLLAAPQAFASAQDVARLRELYYGAITDEKYAKEMLKLLENTELPACQTGVKSKPVYAGYKGIAYLYISRHASFPISKYSNFKKGSELLDAAIKSDPLNMDLHYFRFAVQTKAPRFLNYYENIEEDKKNILSQITNCQDMKFKNHIVDFMLASQYCSPAEKALLKK